MMGQLRKEEYLDIGTQRVAAGGYPCHKKKEYLDAVYGKIMPSVRSCILPF